MFVPVILLHAAAFAASQTEDGSMGYLGEIVALLGAVLGSVAMGLGAVWLAGDSLARVPSKLRPVVLLALLAAATGAGILLFEGFGSPDTLAALGVAGGIASVIMAASLSMAGRKWRRRPSLGRFTARLLGWSLPVGAVVFLTGATVVAATGGYLHHLWEGGVLPGIAGFGAAVGLVLAAVAVPFLILSACNGMYRERFASFWGAGEPRPSAGAGG